MVNIPEPPKSKPVPSLSRLIRKHDYRKKCVSCGSSQTDSEKLLEMKERFDDILSSKSAIFSTSSPERINTIFIPNQNSEVAVIPLDLLKEFQELFWIRLKMNQRPSKKEFQAYLKIHKEKFVRLELVDTTNPKTSYPKYELRIIWNKEPYEVVLCGFGNINHRKNNANSTRANAETVKILELFNQYKSWSKQVLNWLKFYGVI